MCNSCLRESVFESEWLESHLASTPHLEIDSESRHFAHLVPSEPAILWCRENCHWTHRSIWVAWRSYIKGWEEFNMGKNQFKKKEKIPATSSHWRDDHSQKRKNHYHGYKCATHGSRRKRSLASVALRCGASIGLGAFYRKVSSRVRSASQVWIKK